MKFKPTQILVDSNNPFEQDALNRKPSVEALTGFIESLSGPFVLAIDSPWGTGKTTFIKMWQSVLEHQEFACLYFNAWETDFSTDPMIAFVGEIGSLMQSIQKDEGSFQPHLAKTKKIATALANRAIPAALRVVTAGILDIDTISEKAIGDAVAETVNDAVDIYTAEKSLMIQFHETLDATISTLKESGKKTPLVIFVDEIDRCRPSYAIDLLERIKHLFNIENAIFVIALDKEQLSVSLKGIYGDGLNTEEYLRRFIDIEFTLPEAEAKSFTANLISRFGFEEYFHTRTHPELRNDFDNFRDTFNELSTLFCLSLRAREQCFTRIAIALKATPTDHYLYPILLTALTILRIAAPKVYKHYVMGDGTTGELLKYFQSIKGGSTFLNSHAGAVMESYLILAKLDRNENSPELAMYQSIIENQNADPSQSERANKILRITQGMRFNERGATLGQIINKIELAAKLSRT